VFQSACSATAVSPDSRVKLFILRETIIKKKIIDKKIKNIAKKSPLFFKNFFFIVYFFDN